MTEEKRSADALSPAQQQELEAIRRWAQRLDAQWEIAGIKVGWDALLGLLPIAGDVVSVAISLMLINKSRRMGVPPGVLLRMLKNVALECLCGSVPVLGDITDIAWRANLQNVALLERHFQIAPSPYSAAPHQGYTLVLIGFILLAVLLAAFYANGIYFSV